MAGVLAWRAAGGDRRAGLGARGVRGEGGGERWGADAARGEVRMRGVLVRGEPQGSPFFVRVLRGDWRRLLPFPSMRAALWGLPCHPICPATVKILFRTFTLQKARGGQ